MGTAAIAAATAAAGSAAWSSIGTAAAAAAGSAWSSMHEVLTAAAAAESAQLSAGMGVEAAEEEVRASDCELMLGRASLMWLTEECTRKGRRGLEACPDDDDDEHLSDCVLLRAQCILWRAI